MNLIWDVEHVLLDAMPAIQQSLRRVARAYDSPVDVSDLSWVTQLPVRDTLAVLLNSQSPELIDEAEKRYCDEFHSNGKEAISFYRQAEQLLPMVAADPQLSSHYYTHIGRSGAENMLRRFGLLDSVGTLYTGDKHCCPQRRLALLAEIRSHLCETEGQSVKSCVMVSDSPRELIHAAMLGMRTVGIAYGPTPLRVIRSANPELIARNPQQVLPCVAMFQNAGGRTH